MDVRETQLSEEEAKGHWYFQSKARALQRTIDDLDPQGILDVGAGSGFFCRWLLKHTDASQGICVDTGYTHARSESAFGKNVFYCPHIEKAGVDLVLLMDVLEHVDNDVALLSDYVDMVPPGTTFILTVPAFSFLWSSHDVFLQHKRRYTLKSLSAVADAAGLHIERRHYYFGLIFPIACVSRLLDKLFVRKEAVLKSALKKHSALTNWFLGTLCLFELPFMSLNKIAGLSVFCRCKKL